MPNWCEGTLKVRGTKENVKRFVLEGLHPVDLFGDAKSELTVNEFGDIYLSEYEDDERLTAVFDSKFAWGINADELLRTCKKYHVDMKIHAFEQGMEFNQVIEIIDGEVIHDYEIHFTDYQWECVCPKLGG